MTSLLLKLWLCQRLIGRTVGRMAAERPGYFVVPRRTGVAPDIICMRRRSSNGLKISPGRQGRRGAARRPKKLNRWPAFDPRTLNSKPACRQFHPSVSPLRRATTDTVWILRIASSVIILQLLSIKQFDAALHNSADFGEKHAILAQARNTGRRPRVNGADPKNPRIANHRADAQHRKRLTAGFSRLRAISSCPQNDVMFS